jgi:hypothetical protein
MGVDERPGLVGPSGDSFAPEAVVAMPSLLCSNTRLNWAGPGRRKQGLESEFDIVLADSALGLCAALVKHYDYRFYDSCCFPVEV